MRVPRYFDAFLGAIAQGARIEHVHLGHWDRRPDGSVPSGGDDFVGAQERLAQKLVTMAALKPGERILDVGCGLGGVARIVDEATDGGTFLGLNIDIRQIEVCRAVRGTRGNRLDWLVADAIALPFRQAAFDCLFCVEAIFHFASRRRFLAEAHRVLRAGGRLVLSDILLQRPDERLGIAPDAIERRLDGDFGPWPEKWISWDALRAYASEAGFVIREEIDATAHTLPSYRTVAPVSKGALSGPDAMRILHESGRLTYVYMVLEKPAS